MPWRATKDTNLEGTVYKAGQEVPEAEKLRGFPLYRTLKKIRQVEQEELTNIVAPSAVSDVNPETPKEPEVPKEVSKEPEAPKKPEVPKKPKLPVLPKASK